MDNIKRRECEHSLRDMRVLKARNKTHDYDEAIAELEDRLGVKKKPKGGK